MLIFCKIVLGVGTRFAWAGLVKSSSLMPRPPSGSSSSSGRRTLTKKSCTKMMGFVWQYNTTHNVVVVPITTEMKTLETFIFFFAHSILIYCLFLVFFYCILIFKNEFWETLQMSKKDAKQSIKCVFKIFFKKVSSSVKF